jgi:hypothetical protein
MNKAEDRALEKYPKKIELVGNQWDGAPFDVNSESRAAYKQGYYQAEKDLELRWEDIKTIDKLLNQCVDYSNPYQEVLKRFKEMKER